MPGIETKIWLALKSRIQSLPGGLAIAYPASVYSPGGAAYIAVSRITVAPKRVYVAKGKHDRTGTLTLAHVSPLGQDVAVYEEAAAAIAAHFPEDECLIFQDIRVRVVAAPHVVEGFRDKVWWRTPVNIAWRCSA